MQGKVSSLELDTECLGKEKLFYYYFIIVIFFLFLELLKVILSVKDEYQPSSPSIETLPVPLEGKAANEYKRITDKSK